MDQLKNKRSYAWRRKTGLSNIKTSAIAVVNPDFWIWLAGFIDGEGSFKVIVKKKVQTGIGFEVMPCIDICQGIVRKNQMVKLSKELGSGLLIERKALIGNDMCSLNIYRIQDVKTVLGHVLPHLRFKKDDAEVFQEILRKIDRGEHLTVNGFLEIVHAREKIASGRTKPKTYRSYLWFENYFSGGDNI